MTQPISDEIKQHGLKLYLLDYSTYNIATAVSSEYGMDIGAETVKAWIKDSNWMELKVTADLKAKEKIVRDVIKTKAAKAEEHLAEYQKIRLQASSDLGGLAWSNPADAVKAVDVAIKGERSIHSGVISAQLVSGIIRILIEEIKDDTLRSRIALKLRDLIVDFEEKSHDDEK